MTAHRGAILRWLTDRVASYLEVSTMMIDPLIPLAEMGVGSVHAVSLVGDVEAHFDIDVEPTLVFDYPTLTRIADYIAAALAMPPAAPSAGDVA